MAMTPEQLEQFQTAWAKRVIELIEVGYDHPGEPFAHYKPHPQLTDDAFELAFTDHRVAVDSWLTVERANLFRYWRWRVIWVDPDNFDVWDIVNEVAGEIVDHLRKV